MKKLVRPQFRRATPEEAPPWSERMIARAISQQVLHNKCIVLIENTSWTGHEADVLGVTMDMRLIDVEVKISRSDLKADYHKEKWWTRLWPMMDGPPQLHGWPPRVWKHYYALPQEIWKPELEHSLPSPKSGILLMVRGIDGRISIHCTRRATPDRDCSRLTAADALDVARLANHRMMEAYADLEVALHARDHALAMQRAAT